MPGVDLQLTYPTVGMTVTNFVTTTAVALAAIAEDLAARVVTSELDMNATLSMEGNAITHCSSLVLTHSAPVGGAGTLYYQDGEFNVVTAAGVVRLTLDGALDSASIGGITGLGGTDAAALFDNASNEFRFTHQPGSSANLRCADVILVGSAGSVRLSVPSSVTTVLECDLALPTSGVKPLAYDAAAGSLADATVTRETGTHLMASANLSGALVVTGAASVGADLTLGADIVHSTWEASGSFSLGDVIYISGTSVTTNGVNPGVVVTGPTIARVRIPVHLRANQRITSVTLHFGDALGAGSAKAEVSTVAAGSDSLLNLQNAVTYLVGATSVVLPTDALLLLSAHLTAGMGLYAWISTTVSTKLKGWTVSHTGI